MKPRDLNPEIRGFGIPATRIAEELGHRIILNIVMVGFFTAVSGLVSEEAVRRAVEASVPSGTESLNINAFKRGYRYGKEQI